MGNWLLPDDQQAWLGPKNLLIDSQAHDVFVEAAGSRAAQQEAAVLISQECGAQLRHNEAPLLAASRLVSDDLVVMEWVGDQWVNTACVLCNPTFFSAHHAGGKSLIALHGPVPDGGFGLAARIDRVFTNLPATTILERHNWTVQWSDARFTPNFEPLRQQAVAAAVAEASDNLFLRVERQTIRRLPRSGAILFTIRIRLTRLSALLTDPTHKADFEHAWYQAPEPVRHYKHWEVFERHVAFLLARN